MKSRRYYFAALHICALPAPFFYTRDSIIAFLVLYLITGFGITIGYHRLLAHQAFKTTSIVKRILVTAGALAAQGGPLFWVSVHRNHHKSTDQEADPHNSQLGFWWAHIGWLLSSNTDFKIQPNLIPDLLEKRWLKWLDQNFLLLQLCAAWLLFIIVFLLTDTYNTIAMMIWAIPLRIIAVLHSTWLTNSAAHLWGYRSFKTPDNSRNCWWVALLTLGEGWHNNHHAFPYSARHGLHRLELDPSWYLILALHRIGVVWDLKLAPIGIRKK